MRKNICILHIFNEIYVEFIELLPTLIDHQKLWVAHASIANHAEAHAHYEMCCSMQLFQEPKDFRTQQHYLNLLRKKASEELTTEDLQEIIGLYAFALTHNHELFAFFRSQREIAKISSTLIRAGEKVLK